MANIFALFVGTNDTGKTQRVTKFIAHYKGPVLVVNPAKEKKFFGFKNEAGSFAGLPVITPEIKTIKYDNEIFDANIFPQYMKENGITPRFQTVPKVRFGQSYEEALLPILEAVFYSFKEGLLVLDDCSMLLRGSITKATESIFVSRRQKNIDMIAIFHGLGKVPPGLIPYITGIQLHKIVEESDTYKYKIPDRILQAKKRLDLKTRSNRYYSEYIKL